MPTTIRPAATRPPSILLCRGMFTCGRLLPSRAASTAPACAKPGAISIAAGLTLDLSRFANHFSHLIHRFALASSSERETMYRQLVNRQRRGAMYQTARWAGVLIVLGVAPLVPAQDNKY